MDNIVKNPPFPKIFGPINKDWCFYFYILSAIAFVSLVVTVLGALWIGITKRKGVEFFFTSFFIAFVYAIVYAISYLQSRLFYNICNKTL